MAAVKARPGVLNQFLFSRGREEGGASGGTFSAGCMFLNLPGKLGDFIPLAVAPRLLKALEV